VATYTDASLAATGIEEVLPYNVGTIHQRFSCSGIDKLRKILKYFNSLSGSFATGSDDYYIGL
jgi:hypothetical protein